MSDTSDTGTRDTGDTGEGEGTVEAGPAEEVILVDGGREIDVTDRPNDAFPPGSQVPEQSQSSAADTPRQTKRPIASRDIALDSSVVRARPGGG